MNTRIRWSGIGIAGFVAAAAVATVFPAPQAGACEFSGSVGLNLTVCGGVPTTGPDAYYVNGVYTFTVNFPDPAHRRFDKPVNLFATYDPDVDIDPVLHRDQATLVGSVTAPAGSTSASIQWTPLKPGHYDFLAEDGDGVKYGPMWLTANAAPPTSTPTPTPTDTDSANSVPGLWFK
ncbi:hypothetical protein [Nocardia arthritidis]|uniref:Uncharacterized protein n=1 Tax=Nocardia arthritidis TaxID=228602 RepID=A0A6G9YGI7_9NOCA|nr:hypothetical protein [Nocardia arthritidis]QIS12166.1 hypothetical protein F5544_21515 [Nocardia arthritidis]